jgi:DNA ligase D-like protein (predicted ligase)
MQIRDERAARASGVPVWFYIFDLLRLNGRDTRQQPLRDRKRLLAEAFEFRDPVRYTEHRETDGEAAHAEACKQGWEGVIAKRADSAYIPGRSRDWLKFKCSNQQEFVVVGFTEPQGERVEFGALLVGYYADGNLRYAGKVGTGYDDDTLRRLGARLRALEVHSPPVTERVPGRGVHWVKPVLVAQVAFTEWTADGKLRHPRFQGLREDKAARQVVREG